ncbi:hypothetical protein RvY_08794 [Ramazzottius varieornatus]|uniref:Protein arginine methyltransferase NDUFAF7 n=1 Tax=Ramazzottius varieornatus TaxID=947166 RepID=A0A1D1VBR7_RAMVA|nr:hypothetical protein RvY_08794 [Ramazzottius varieornatus]
MTMSPSKLTRIRAFPYSIAQQKCRNRACFLQKSGSPTVVSVLPCKSMAQLTEPDGTRHPQPSEFLRYLQQRMKSTGPISIAEYMKECLTNPYYGYYTRKEPFGKSGDFITSPEVCQIFGELIGLWCVNEWSILGGPKPFQIIELGPGTGTLAYDLLRVLKSIPQTSGQVSLHLVEKSRMLAKIQAEKLRVKLDFVDEHNSFQQGLSQIGSVPVFWYQRIEDVPRAPSFIVANEFFDALPIHKLQKTSSGLREVLVDITEDKSDLRFVIAHAETAVVRVVPPKSRERDHLEFSLEAATVLDDVSSRVSTDGGSALIIDYGHEGTKADTLRGFHKHQVVEPLAAPGETDLTTDVDFSLMKHLLEDKALCFGPITQSKFLYNMAFEQRFNALLRACRSSEEEERLAKACDLLINPEKMGGQFFAFSIVGYARSKLGPVTGGF